MYIYGDILYNCKLIYIMQLHILYILYTYILYSYIYQMIYIIRILHGIIYYIIEKPFCIV